MREIYIEERVRLSSLFIIVMLLVFATAGLGHFSDIALEVYAQKSSSCNRVVVSLVDCSPSTSSSSSSDDTSAADDNDEEDNNDGDNDEGDDGEDQKEDKKGGDIEANIPSTLPFP